MKYEKDQIRFLGIKVCANPNYSFNCTFFIHYIVFHDLHHILKFSVHDIAFLPLEVLLVTLVIERILSIHEKRERRFKIKMLIGAFFSEAGNGTIRLLRNGIPDELAQYFSSTNVEKLASMPEKEIPTWLDRIEYPETVELSIEQLEKLKNLLEDKREFLVRLLENPVILQDESFTNTLFALFHLSDELSARKSFSELPKSDLDHIKGDIMRVSKTLFVEWILYMRHLSDKYPYLYSLELRTNSFDKQASPIVKG